MKRQSFRQDTAIWVDLAFALRHTLGTYSRSEPLSDKPRQELRCVSEKQCAAGRYPLRLRGGVPGRLDPQRCPVESMGLST